LNNFSLLKHRSFEAVVTGDVNAKRQSSLAIGICQLANGDRLLSWFQEIRLFSPYT